MNLLLFIIAGFALYFLFRLLMRIGKSFLGRNFIRRNILAILPILELALWIAYVFWGIHILFGGHIYYEFIVILMAAIIMAAIAWFVFRDFLAGVLLKAEKSLEPGQKVKTPHVEGRIKKLGSRSVEIINNEGGLVRLPYSRLSNEILILPPSGEEKLPHHTVIKPAMEENFERARDAVMARLLAMPWITDPAPEVNIGKSEEGETVLKITYYTYISSQAATVEDKLRGEFNVRHYGSQ